MFVSTTTQFRISKNPIMKKTPLFLFLFVFYSCGDVDNTNGFLSKFMDFESEFQSRKELINPIIGTCLSSPKEEHVKVQIKLTGKTINLGHFRLNGRLYDPLPCFEEGEGSFTLKNYIPFSSSDSILTFDTKFRSIKQENVGYTLDIKVFSLIDSLIGKYPKGKEPKKGKTGKALAYSQEKGTIFIKPKILEDKTDSISITKAPSK